MVTQCGKVHTSSDINSTWQTVIQPNEERISGPASLKPDPTSVSHIILCLGDGTQRRIYTAGHIEHYHYDNPLNDFIALGLQSITIQSYSVGCFHYNPDIITYRRNGNEWHEAWKNFDSKNFTTRHFPVATVEETLRPMMPDGMLLKDYLDNKTLQPRYKYLSGDLLFCSRHESDMEEAIGSSTGEFTHVAIVEVDSTGKVWIIEATSSKGVQRIPYSDWSYREFSAYRLNVPFDTAAVIARAKSFIGQPYDDSFLPDNGQMYCSELVYEAYLDSNGNHIFQSQPMNFRNKRGKMPKYWKKHFRKLGIAIPEGVQGTNPTDMSKSQLLENVL